VSYKWVKRHLNREMLYDPVEKNCWHAVRGGGIYKNGRPWPRGTPAIQEPDRTAGVSPAPRRGKCPEAGAVATDFSGDPLDLNRADSTFMNHRGIMLASDAALAKKIRLRPGGG
jgi:fructose-1,6-bisphosphatase/inositol monophosphatase family enzyme